MSFLAGCPTGVIFAYGGTTAPDGWIVCDGTPISRSTYASLFTAIGVVHGAGDGSTTFHLPDYRGRILRGRDGGIARDPDRASRTAANSGGATGDAVGSVQAEATKKNGMTITNAVSTGMSANTTHGHGVTDTGHNHDYTITNFTAAAGNVTGVASGMYNGAQPTTQSGNRTTGISVNTSASIDHTHTSNVTLNTGDNETRPLNAYVNYIIKI